MMKKVWLVLLAVVLVFGLVVSCGGGSSKEEEEGEDLVEKVVFDLETDEGIQALEVGVLSFAANANPIKPLVRAGGDSDVSIEAVDNGGKIALKFTTSASWGAGIDLRHVAGDGGIGFAFVAGDKIKMAGEFVSGSGKVQINGKVGAENATIGGTDTRITENGAFEVEITLTAADVTALKGGSPAGLRIEGREGGIVAQINTLNVTGMRPSNAKPLPAPVLVAGEENVVTWAEVDGAGGYKVFVAAEGGEFGTTATASLGPAAKSYSLLDASALPDGSYQVKAIALGIEGSSKDSPDSNVVTVPKVTPAQLVLYEAPDFKTGYEATVGEDSGNTVIEFTNKIDTTGKIRVYIQLDNATHNYCGGSVEGNDTMTGSEWVNHQSWSGFDKVEPDESGKTDTFYSTFTYDDGGTEKTIGAFKKICIQGAVSFDEVAKIWIE